MFLLWAGLFFIVLGVACVAIDRRAVHFLYDRVSLSFHNFLNATTHYAKAAHWLAFAALTCGVCYELIAAGDRHVAVRLAFQYALSFIISLGAGSAVLHSVKLVLGRRRPRDELEMNLYGFIPFGFNLDWNSFPSGHSLTIFCVAVIATALWPHFALLWFAIALWLGLTRALLTAHFLSDVFVGAGVGLITTREVLVNFFPHLALGWF